MTHERREIALPGAPRAKSMTSTVANGRRADSPYETAFIFGRR
jgi:hypothetical protein